MLGQHRSTQRKVPRGANDEQALTEDIVALAIIADRFGPRAEREALGRLLKLRPEATPNLVAVELADQVLRRSVQLVSALAA